MKILIKNARIVDPLNKIDEVGDIYIENGKVRKEKSKKIDRILNASGLFLFPGFIDIHTHIREPGWEDVETIQSGLRAAAAGGYTSICMMPNTKPALDNDGVVLSVIKKAKSIGLSRLFPIGAATRGRKGRELTEIGHLLEAGCVGFSDDGNPVENSLILRRILEYTKGYHTTFIEHPEDKNLTASGDINEGNLSINLGMLGIPSVAETVIVGRDILLSHYLNSSIHLAHISTADSLSLIDFGRKKKVDVTIEVTPHHLVLDENYVSDLDTNFKMYPPLRKKEDRVALVKALKNDFIDAIATDHAPHPKYTKELEFSLAPFGVIGLETSFSVLFSKLVEGGEISLKKLLKHFTSKPANILGLPFGQISEGGLADFVLFDPQKEWEVTEESFHSLSKNSPFLGWKLKGKTRYTILNGTLIYQDGEFQENPNGW